MSNQQKKYDSFTGHRTIYTTTQYTSTKETRKHILPVISVVRRPYVTKELLRKRNDTKGTREMDQLSGRRKTEALRMI